MSSLYRVGDALFVVTVEHTPAGSVAELWRAQDGILARVLDPDGTPFTVTAPAAWQAQHRAATRLESFMRERAYGESGDTWAAAPREGTWRLPG
jgi:hypothetical protein